jgi:hypothetical protein
MATLREWGVSVIEPEDTGRGLRLAALATILAEVDARKV